MKYYVTFKTDTNLYYQGKLLTDQTIAEIQSRNKWDAICTSHHLFGNNSLTVTTHKPNVKYYPGGIIKLN